MQIAETLKTADSGTSGLNEGVLDNRYLLTGREGSLDNYSLHISRTVEEYTLPRHRHNLEQIRFAVEGQSIFDGRPLPEGWVGYFPESLPYGPQLRETGSLILTAQFGGSTGGSYISKRQQRIAQEALSREGSFRKGVYSWQDEAGHKHNLPSYEAIWQQATGRKMVYPPPRYETAFFMNPDNFEWVDQPGTPGLAFKWLGSFTERGTCVGFIRLDPGASYGAGCHAAPELLFVAGGEVGQGGRRYGRYSAFGLEAGEGPVAITATEPSELLCLRLPIYGNSFERR